MLALPTLCLAIPLSPLLLVFPSTYPSSCTQGCSEEAWLFLQGICTLPSNCHKISRSLNALFLTFLWTLFARSLAKGRTFHISSLHHLFMATSVSQNVIRYSTRNLKAPFLLVDNPHSSECFSEVCKSRKIKHQLHGPLAFKADRKGLHSAVGFWNSALSALRWCRNSHTAWQKSWACFAAHLLAHLPFHGKHWRPPALKLDLLIITSFVWRRATTEADLIVFNSTWDSYLGSWKNAILTESTWLLPWPFWKGFASNK